MNSFTKRINALERTRGKELNIHLWVDYTADGRIIHDGQVYSDSEALCNAKGITQGVVYLISWGNDPVPGEETHPREEPADASHADGQETSQAPVDRVASVAGNPATESVVYNPFIQPMPEHLKPRQTRAIMPKTVFGPDSMFGNYAYPYWGY